MSIDAEIWNHAATTLDDLLRHADGEMYADKSSRPSRHEGLVRALPDGVVPHQESNREVRK